MKTREYKRTLKSLVADFIRDKQPEDVSYYQEVCDWLDSLPADSKIERKKFQRGYEKGFKDGALGSEIIESFSAKSKEDEDNATPILSSPFKYYTDRGITISCGDLVEKPDMSKAEEAAVKAYPENIEYEDWGGCRDINLDLRIGYQDGYEQAEKELGWHSVEETLPEIDEEVIVLTDKIAMYKIGFGHIVDKTRCVDYNGWNIPGVKFWMPYPKIPNND